MKRLILTALLALAGVRGVYAQDVSLSTNIMDYVQLGTFNAEGMMALSRHWSLAAGFRYNPFSYDGGKGGEGMQARQQTYALGARWWPWHIMSGWWLSGKLQYQEYNVGGIRSPETTEGDRYGAGLAAGYSYMLGKHLNLDIGVGVWSGNDNYVSYACPRCGRITGSGERMFFRMNDILLSFAYVF